MTASSAPQIVIPRWRAFDSKGVGHAFLSRKAPAACGRPNVDERHDWPRRSKCQLCVKAIEGID